MILISLIIINILLDLRLYMIYYINLYTHNKKLWNKYYTIKILLLANVYKLLKKKVRNIVNNRWQNTWFI